MPRTKMRRVVCRVFAAKGEEGTRGTAMANLTKKSPQRLFLIGVDTSCVTSTRVAEIVLLRLRTLLVSGEDFGGEVLLMRNLATWSGGFVERRHVEGRLAESVRADSVMAENGQAVP